jgi:tetratricopeptide (TPR) repeat protein
VTNNAGGRSGGGRPTRGSRARTGRERRTGREDAGQQRGARGDAGRESAESRSGSGPRPERSGRPATHRPGTTTRRGSADRTPPAPHLNADDADPGRLDPATRAELRTLSKPNAEAVARHLVAAGDLLDANPERALAHARAARARAGRVAVVREAVGIAAYRAGEWAEALSELRAARRMSGDPRGLPVMADSERALGRPQQAIRLLRDRDVGKLDAETYAELLIVVAGARRDLGQLDAALTVLAKGGLDRERPGPGSIRLWYAYADALAAAERRQEAAQWFAAAAALDVAGDTDAAERAAELV